MPGPTLLFPPSKVTCLSLLSESYLALQYARDSFDMVTGTADVHYKHAEEHIAFSPPQVCSLPAQLAVYMPATQPL